MALALELVKKVLPPRNSTSGFWPSVMTMRASSAAPLRASATEKASRPGLSRSWKSRTWSGAGADVDRCRLAARVVPARGVQRIFARREFQAIGALVSHYPGVRLAVPFCDHDGLPQRCAVAAADRARTVPAGSCPRSISAPTTGARSPLDPTCSHPVNVRLS